MSSLIQFFVLCCAVAYVGGIVIRALNISHAIENHKQRAIDFAGCGTLGFVGCSVVCSRITNIDQIEALLSSEYDHYEVVVALDGRIDGEALNAIVRHFKMIRVNTPSAVELPITHIETLYRSRTRSFRRLALVDVRSGSRYDDFNAAAAVATYDYLLPLAQSDQLRRGAIEAIAIALSDFADKQIDLLRSTADGSYIIRREALIEAEGFGPSLLRRIPHNVRFSIALPLRQVKAKALNRGVIGGAIVIGFLLLFAMLISAPAVRICFMAAAIALIGIARYLSIIMEEKESVEFIMYNIGHSVSLFLKRLFFV